MKIAKWHTQEDKQDLKEAMLEQAINNIMEDPDRIEKIIEENSDIIQDIFFQNRQAQPDSDMILGFNIRILIERKIEYLADEDVEEALR